MLRLDLTCQEVGRLFACLGRHRLPLEHASEIPVKHCRAAPPARPGEGFYCRYCRVAFVLGGQLSRRWTSLSSTHVQRGPFVHALPSAQFLKTAADPMLVTQLPSRAWVFRKRPLRAHL